MRVLNYLELSVFKNVDDATHSDRARAVVLSFGHDLFDSLEQAVFELRKSGWTVDDVKRFKTDVPYEKLAHDNRLRRTHDRARSEGIDWFIDGAVSAPAVAG